MMLAFKNTKTVAQELGIKVQTLSQAVWDGRIQPPEKSPAGHYLWQEADIQRAAHAFGVKYVKPLTGLYSVGCIAQILSVQRDHIFELIKSGAVVPSHRVRAGGLIFNTPEMGLIAKILKKEKEFQAFIKLPVGKAKGVHSAD